MYQGTITVFKETDNEKKKDESILARIFILGLSNPPCKYPSVNTICAPSRARKLPVELLRTIRTDLLAANRNAAAFATAPPNA